MEPSSPKPLVLFGATGQTGRHVLTQALEAGKPTRCYVRAPSKIPDQQRTHSLVEVVQGDFADSDGVKAALEGAGRVVCVGAGPKTYQPRLMVDLTKSIVAGMRAHDVSRLVLQAGALSHAPGSVSPLLVRLLLRPIMGTAAGLMGMLRDNDELMAWLHAEARDLEWTVTRPGRIVDEPSRGSLETSSTLSDTSTFVDLASLSLDLVSRSAYVHAFPYVNYRA